MRFGVHALAHPHAPLIFQDGVLQRNVAKVALKSGLEGRFLGLGAFRDASNAAEGANAHVAAAGEEGDLELDFDFKTDILVYFKRKRVLNVIMIGIPL